jgi:hypothetical protein
MYTHKSYNSKTTVIILRHFQREGEKAKKKNDNTTPCLQKKRRGGL